MVSLLLNWYLQEHLKQNQLSHVFTMACLLYASVYKWIHRHQHLDGIQNTFVVISGNVPHSVFCDRVGAKTLHKRDG